MLNKLQDQESDRLNGLSDSEPAPPGHDEYHPHLLCINHLRLSSCHPLDLNNTNTSENLHQHPHHHHHQADDISETSDNTSKSTTFNRLMVNDCSSDSNQYSPSSSFSHSGDFQMDKKGSNNSSKQVLDKSSDEYRLRRERNNIAVRKSRSKSKLKFVQTVERISQLEHENRVLIGKVKSMSRDLNILKFILIKHVNGGLGAAAYDLDSDNFKADSMDSDQ